MTDGLNEKINSLEQQLIESSKHIQNIQNEITRLYNYISTHVHQVVTINGQYTTTSTLYSICADPEPVEQLDFTKALEENMFPPKKDIEKKISNEEFIENMKKDAEINNKFYKK